MKDENNKTEYITQTDLEEQTQAIIAAVDSIMEKRTGEIQGEIKGVREELYSVRNELKEEIQATKSELKRDFNNVQTLIDGYVNAQEDFKQEFVIMKEEINQIKKVIKEKMGLEIRAI
jgi:hypothetical protein